ncbi:MAG: NAD(P)/FAD-dependent oxidoreductase [Ilumatobacteraceae bacterium]
MQVVVIGAGLAGLCAARDLVDAGHSVTVLEKSRASGGRCATRRIGDATFDHGAQFFTARSAEFTAMVEQWITLGIAREWCRGFGAGDGHSRYCGTAGMTTIAKHLATGLDVRYNALAFDIRPEGGAWVVMLDDASRFVADAVVVTCPIPQALSLLAHTDLEVPDGIRTITYDKTIAALVVVQGGTNVPEPGGVQSGDAVFSFIADNHRKGISACGALTFHANAAFSEEHWWNDADATHRLLLEHARPWIGDATIVDHQPKRWRMATPRTIWPEQSWAQRRIVLAGDAFAGPRVEGAVLSGRAAARHLLT